MPGEYWEYNVDSPGGTFEVVLRAASNSGGTGRQLEVTVDGVTLGVATYDGTGWQTFADYSVGTISMPAGPHTVRVTSLTGNTNFNHIDFRTVMVGCSNGTLPGKVEAEDYCAFFESDTSINHGAANFPACDRGDGVDIEATVDDHTPELQHRMDRARRVLGVQRR